MQHAQHATTCATYIYTKHKHSIIICLAVEVATCMNASLVVTLILGRKAYKGTLKTNTMIKNRFI